MSGTKPPAAVPDTPPAKTPEWTEFNKRLTSRKPNYEEVHLGSTGPVYLGDSSTDGSWRIVQRGRPRVQYQHKESNMWTVAIPSIISGLTGVAGSKLAGDKISEGAESAYKMYQQGREDLAPWREVGEKALQALWGKVQAGPGEFKESPGYKFRLAEGEKAIERSAAARGNMLSGATLKGLTRHGQEYATSDFDNFLRRYYDSLNPYQDLSRSGQSSAAMQARQGMEMGQNYLAAGRDQGAQYINMANALTGNLRSGVKDYLYFNQQNQEPPSPRMNWLGYSGGGYAGNRGIR
jgi:hypothetical protein